MSPESSTRLTRTTLGTAATSIAVLALASCAAGAPKATETAAPPASTAIADATSIPTASAEDTTAATPTEESTSEATATKEATQEATPTEKASNPTTSGANTSNAKATAGPTRMGHYTAGDEPDLEEFPVGAATIEGLIERMFPDGGVSEAKCDGDVDITAGKPSATCTYTFDGKEHTAYAYGTFSNIQGTGILITLDTPLDASLANTFTAPGTQVLSYGSGTMFAQGEPAPAKDVAALVKGGLDAYEIPVKSVSCNDDVFIDNTTNQVVCPVDAEWGAGEATVIASYLASVQENGILIVIGTPAD